MDPYGFLGKGIKFPLQIDKKTGFIAMEEHEEDIREAIGIILNTYMGERVMRPTFGTTIEDYVFDSDSALRSEDLAGTVAQLLQAQELRIKDVNAELENADEAYAGAIVLKISYTVRTTNNRYNHVYPFYMDEGNQEESII